MTTIALFGGSFNPPHVAHQMVCLFVLSTAEVDGLWMVPAYRHVFAKELAPFDDRLEMCRRAAAVFGDRVEVLDVERELGGESRTYDTLRALGDRHPGVRFRLVIGADILDERDRWYRWDDVARLAPPIVVARQGYPGSDPNVPAMPDISSTEIRERIARGESAVPLVPRSVMDYIAERGLYL